MDADRGQRRPRPRGQSRAEQSSPRMLADEDSHATSYYSSLFYSKVRACDGHYLLIGDINAL
jgi:hypothetical protein